MEKACPHCGRPASDFLRGERGLAAHVWQCPPEARARHSAAIKAMHARPEVKARRAGTAKAVYNRPGERERHSAIMKKVNARPGIKAKQRAAARERGTSWDLDDRGGYVYYMRNKRDGAGKVGSAFNVRERQRRIESAGYVQFAAPGDPVEVVLAVRCDYFRRVEMRAHELLGMDDYYKASYGEQTPPDVTLDEVVAAIEQAVAEIDRESGVSSP